MLLSSKVNLVGRGAERFIKNLSQRDTNRNQYSSGDLLEIGPLISSDFCRVFGNNSVFLVVAFEAKGQHYLLCRNERKVNLIVYSLSQSILCNLRIILNETDNSVIRFDLWI